MNINTLHLVFFSATNTTKQLVIAVGKGIDAKHTKEYNITQETSLDKVQLDANDLLVVGVPSFSGRVPQLCITSLNRFVGINTPAILVCAYGNRDYDDTLLELKDSITANGFKVISAGAFVAQHSIFPTLASQRPNEADLTDASLFGTKSVAILASISDTTTLPDIKVKGNYPYRKAGKLPIRPTGNRKCDQCGICVHMCPTLAISMKNPRKTNKEKCISCARCIVVCPQHARAFRGLIYKIANNKFVKNFSARKENETIYLEA